MSVSRRLVASSPTPRAMQAFWMLFLLSGADSFMTSHMRPLRFAPGRVMPPGTASVRLAKMASGQGRGGTRDARDERQDRLPANTSAASPPVRAAALATFIVVTSVMPFCWSVWANPFLGPPQPFRLWLVLVSLAYALLLDKVSDMDSVGGTLRRAGVTNTQAIKVFEAQRKVGYAIFLPFLLVGSAGLLQWDSSFWSTLPAGNNIWSIVPDPVVNYVAAPAYFLAVFADRAIKRVPSPKGMKTARNKTNAVMRIRGGHARLWTFGRQAHKQVLATWRLWGTLSVPACIAYVVRLARNEETLLVFKVFKEEWQASEHPPQEIFKVFRDCLLLYTVGPVIVGPAIILACMVCKVPRPIPMRQYFTMQRAVLWSQWSIVTDALKTTRKHLWPAMRGFAGCFMAIALQTEVHMRLPRSNIDVSTRVFLFACAVLVSFASAP